MVVMAPLPRSCALGPLRLALGNAAITGSLCSARMSIRSVSRRQGGWAFGGEGFGYDLLRHYGSIERRALLGNDLRAQRAGSGRVHKTRAARVLDAMHDGGLAVVGVGL